jgi:hypothetical protein
MCSPESLHLSSKIDFPCARPFVRYWCTRRRNVRADKTLSAVFIHLQTLPYFNLTAFPLNHCGRHTKVCKHFCRMSANVYVAIILAHIARGLRLACTPLIEYLFHHCVLSTAFIAIQRECDTFRFRRKSDTFVTTQSCKMPEMAE